MLEDTCLLLAAQLSASVTSVLHTVTDGGSLRRVTVDFARETTVFVKLEDDPELTSPLWVESEFTDVAGVTVKPVAFPTYCRPTGDDVFTVLSVPLLANIETRLDTGTNELSPAERTSLSDVCIFSVFVQSAEDCAGWVVADFTLDASFGSQVVLATRKLASLGDEAASLLVVTTGRVFPQVLSDLPPDSGNRLLFDSLTVPVSENVLKVDLVDRTAARDPVVSLSTVAVFVAIRFESVSGSVFFNVICSSVFFSATDLVPDSGCVIIRMSPVLNVSDSNCSNDPTRCLLFAPATTPCPFSLSTFVSRPTTFSELSLRAGRELRGAQTSNVREVGFSFTFSISEV